MDLSWLSLQDRMGCLKSAKLLIAMDYHFTRRLRQLCAWAACGEQSLLLEFLWTVFKPSQLLQFLRAL
jgi:hypothetical protein